MLSMSKRKRGVEAENLNRLYTTAGFLYLVENKFKISNANNYYLNYVYRSELAVFKLNLESLSFLRTEHRAATEKGRGESGLFSRRAQLKS